ncbi:MAG TPA: helix-turn-helix domain-containing protein, partial [Oryzihumus sp.]
MLFGQGLTFPQIAAVIGRDRSTLWREVTRNHAYRGGHVVTGAVHPGRSTRTNPDGLGGVYRWRYCHRHA